MASKFSEFLEGKKIDPRRVASASQSLEKLRPEDRALKLKHRLSKKAEGGEKAEAGTKPRSGRPVTPQLMSKAIAGKPLTGPGKTRLLRAVNRVLEQKKQEPVDIRALF
ncbi:MAG TPA: hypothetical protein VH062_08085 [Polyangiaceae bacterium]|jgi:hypothetical protein|nr:hypothetical protein [Polyangiaceae bacterium]